MVTMTGSYIGELRTEVTHIKSQNTLISDAPPDNNGKGEAFSPTDLTCASLSSCMMTVMGILARREGIRLEGLRSSIVKRMASEPRRILEIDITFTHDNLEATPAQKEKLKRAAINCPVALSLSDTVKQTVIFNF